MSRNARTSLPQRTTIDSRAPMMPASATPPRCDLLSRGGSTSSTSTTAAAASTMRTGRSELIATAGVGTTGLIVAGSARPARTAGGPSQVRVASFQQGHAALALDLGEQGRDRGLGL